MKDSHHRYSRKNAQKQSDSSLARHEQHSPPAACLGLGRDGSTVSRKDRPGVVFASNDGLSRIF